MFLIQRCCCADPAQAGWLLPRLWLRHLCPRTERREVPRHAAQHQRQGEAASQAPAHTWAQCESSWLVKGLLPFNGLHVMSLHSTLSGPSWKQSIDGKVSAPLCCVLLPCLEASVPGWAVYGCAACSPPGSSLHHKAAASLLSLLVLDNHPEKIPAQPAAQSAALSHERLYACAAKY